MPRERLAVRLAIAAGAVCLGVTGWSHGQSATRAVFVAHYFPINSVSPIGATVAAFRINADDTATLVGNYPSGEWTQSLALSPDGRWLASANGTSSTTVEELRIFRVNADASLTQVLQTTTPDSPLDMTWASNAVLAVTRTRTSGGSSILTYRWDPAASTLTPVDSEPSGVFNSAVVAHPTGPWIYTQDSGGLGGGTPNITQWEVLPDGTLNLVTSIIPNDPPLKPSISPDGRWMFSGTGAIGGNTVVAIALAPATGFPSEVFGSPFVSPGDTPYLTTVSGDNRFLFTGHTVDDTIRVFTIDQQTGEITPTGFSFDAGPRLSLGPIAALGNLLIALKDSNDPIGLYVFRVGPTGDLTQVGPLYSTGNRRPELAMRVWSPPAPTCVADFNGVGGVSVEDVFDFLQAWFGNDPRADLNGDGLGVQDIFLFLEAWFAGCP